MTKYLNTCLLPGNGLSDQEMAAIGMAHALLAAVIMLVKELPPSR